MYQHAATQANISTLRQRGVTIIEPATGRFASGLVGQGRLPDTTSLIGHIRLAIGCSGILAGKKVVVTAGGTREAIDPVRFITNRSSGKQGYALAQAALDAGAAVTLVTASDLPSPVGANIINVSSAEHMQLAVLDHIATADALLMAAAVADFRPQTRATQKIKKKDDSDEAPIIVLSRTPDILMSVKEQRASIDHPQVVVGFAAESEHLLSHARAKLERKGLDLLIANDITASDAGFEVDTNRVIILGADGTQTPLALATKTRIAEAIIEHVAALLP